MCSVLVFDNGWGFHSRVLVAVASLERGSAFYPSGFWFEAILGAGFGGLAALGWGVGAVTEHVESDEWSWGSAI